MRAIIHLARLLPLLTWLAIAPTPPSQAAADRTLAIAYSNDVHGETAPCG
ncbi:MAG: hypothetical protein ACOY3Z_04945 [Thermodesulfobacteriota bacterium]